MAQQPSRRDVFRPPPAEGDIRPIVRHHTQSLRSRDPGFLDGRWATPQPRRTGPSLIVGGDEGGDTESSQVIGEDGDRHELTNLRTQTWPLSYEPISETVHVRWHAGGGGGITWLRDENWTLDEDDNVIVIPAEALAVSGCRVGDVFSAQYLRLDGDQGLDEIDPSVVGFIVPGAFDLPSQKLSFDIPAGTQIDDLLLLTVRGGAGPGGGELCASLSCADSRMELAFQAVGVTGSQTIVEYIWVGTATSLAPIVVDVVPAPGQTPYATGDLVAITGANGFGTVSAVESGSTTPVVDGPAAMAVVWDGNHSFGLITNIDPPTGYTEAGDSVASAYSATNAGFWFDPNATSSPPGTFTGEGCCVIQII